MFKFTEKIGNDIALIYEADTVQGIVDLRNALNPSVLTMRDQQVTVPEQQPAKDGEAQ